MYPMYVITNASKYYGATALIFAKECFKILAEKVNSNLYMLPSSQHELIAIGEEIADVQALKEMVCDVNNSQVEEKDRFFSQGNKRACFFYIPNIRYRRNRYFGM